MSDLEHAREMIALARRDLKALGGMLDAGTFEDEVFGFHAQQAVEKALKAWMCLLGEEYPLTHNIRLLLAILGKCGRDVEIFSELSKYNAFAVDHRYRFPPSPEALDRPATLAEVRELVEHVEKLIGQTETPD